MRSEALSPTSFLKAHKKEESKKHRRETRFPALFATANKWPKQLMFPASFEIELKISLADDFFLGLC